MPTIKDEITHIFAHTNAEAATSDASQVAGVAGRAQKIRDALTSRATDTRDRTRSQFVSDLVGFTSDVELKAIMNKFNPNDNGERIRLILAEWVGKDRFYKDAS